MPEPTADAASATSQEAVRSDSRSRTVPTSYVSDLFNLAFYVFAGLGLLFMTGVFSTASIPDNAPDAPLANAVLAQSRLTETFGAFALAVLCKIAAYAKQMTLLLRDRG